MKEIKKSNIWHTETVWFRIRARVKQILEWICNSGDTVTAIMSLKSLVDDGCGKETEERRHHQESLQLLSSWLYESGLTSCFQENPVLDSLGYEVDVHLLITAVDQEENLKAAVICGTTPGNSHTSVWMCIRLSDTTTSLSETHCHSTTNRTDQPFTGQQQINQWLILEVHSYRQTDTNKKVR